RLKSFASAVVQVGLLDRYLKSHDLGEFMIGAINGDSPLKVALGIVSFEQMVSDSALASGTRLMAVPNGASAGDLPVLAGVQLAEYAVYRRDEQGCYLRLNVDTREAEKMILGLVDDFEVRKLVMVGPGNSVFGKSSSMILERD